VIQLKIVVFPEPLGPIIPTSFPRSTSKSTFFKAAKPPKYFVKPLT